jgi:hypothetical protein
VQAGGFKSRGEGDYLMSHDMEDIVAILDGRPGVAEDISQARMMLRPAPDRGFPGAF